VSTTEKEVQSPSWLPAHLKEDYKSLANCLPELVKKAKLVEGNTEIDKLWQGWF
jgi:hypothetical protein